MKNIITLLLLMSSICWSQENKITGTIKDAKTMETIPFVNIIFKTNSTGELMGSMSNEEGEFSLNKEIKEVEFSHLNYETLNVTLSLNENEIVLEPKVFVLDELIMSDITAQDYLKDLIKQSKIRATKNTKLSTFGREVVKINNQYTKYADGQIDYYIKKGNGKSVLQMNQSRAFKAILHDSTSSKINNTNVNSIDKTVKNAYNFDLIEKIIKSKNYEFERYLRKDENNYEYEFIKIIPDSEINETLFDGFIIIDIKTKSIVEYKVQYAESHKKYSKLINILIAKAKLNDISKWVKFKIVDNQYILIYDKTSFDIFIKMGKKINDNIQSTCDLYVFDYKNDVEIPKKGYEGTSIFDAGTKFTDKYWDKYDAFPLKESDQEFVKKVTKQ